MVVFINTHIPILRPFNKREADRVTTDQSASRMARGDKAGMTGRDS
jgi:hypothetical protein